MSDQNYYGRSASAGGKGTSGLDQGKIFVGGLSWQTTEESLRWHFEQYGPVVSVEVMRDRVTGDPRGFAFVVFKESATVDLVMAESSHEINHKVVDVKRAQARGVAPPSIHGKRDAAPNSEAERIDSSSGSGPSFDRSAGAGTPSNVTPEQQGSKVFVGGKSLVLVRLKLFASKPLIVYM